MKREIILCDSCSKPNLSKKDGTLVSIHVTLEKTRACAEDDAFYSVPIDLCCGCAAVLLDNFVSLETMLERSSFVKSVCKK